MTILSFKLTDKEKMVQVHYITLGKEKKVNIDFEPFKPINTSLYLCDNKFHTEALSALLADDNR